MTEINKSFPNPPGIKPYQHPSERVQSPNPAGGEVSPGQYRQPAPTPPPAPTLEPRR